MPPWGLLLRVCLLNNMPAMCTHCASASPPRVINLVIRKHDWKKNHFLYDLDDPHIILCYDDKTTV